MTPEHALNADMHGVCAQVVDLHFRWSLNYDARDAGVCCTTFIRLQKVYCIT